VTGNRRRRSQSSSAVSPRLTSSPADRRSSRLQPQQGRRLGWNTGHWADRLRVGPTPWGRQLRTLGNEDEEECIRIVHEAVDAGLNLITR